MYDITIKKGRPIRYDLWFGGEPAPTVEWLRDGRTLGSDENTSIELYSKNSIYTERNTVLNIAKVALKFIINNCWILEYCAHYSFRSRTVTGTLENTQSG